MKLTVFVFGESKEIIKEIMTVQRGIPLQTKRLRCKHSADCRIPFFTLESKYDKISEKLCRKVLCAGVDKRYTVNKRKAETFNQEI